MQTTAAPLSPVLPSPAPARGQPAGAATPFAEEGAARLPGEPFNARLEQARTRRETAQAEAADAHQPSPATPGAAQPSGVGETGGQADGLAADVTAPLADAVQTPAADPMMAALAMTVAPTLPAAPGVAPDNAGATSAMSAAAAQASDALALPGAATSPAASAWLETLEQARRLASGLPSGGTSSAAPGVAATVAPLTDAGDADGVSQVLSTPAAAVPVQVAQASAALRGSREPGVGRTRGAALPDAGAVLTGGEAEATPFAAFTAGLHQAATTARADDRAPVAPALLPPAPAVDPAAVPQADVGVGPGEGLRAVALGVTELAGNAMGHAAAPGGPGVVASAGPAGAIPAGGAEGLRQPGALQILDDATLPYQLQHHLRWMQARGQGTAELQLNPTELGPVHVTVKMEERRVEASFLCAQPMTRDLIEAAMPRLREAMESAGMELAGGFVGTGEFGSTPSGDMADGGQAGRFTGGPDAPGNPALGAPPAPTAMRPTHDGLVDTFA